MNSQERFWATTHYATRDRMFHWEMEVYEETIKSWRRQGLPPDSDLEHFGGYDRFETLSVGKLVYMGGLCPEFEVETLREEGEYEIYRDVDGVIKKKRKDTPPPAMPQYLVYSLKDRNDWPEFRRRLNPDSPARFPVHWESIKKQYHNRDFPLGILSGSLYGWLRNWMGVEGISLTLYSDPGFIEQAATEIADCIIGVLDKALDGMQYDFAWLWEDMAYKTSSLISPAHYRKIFLPQYRRITDRLHQSGIDIIMLDCDGKVDELIPCWLDVGINFIYPMEVAAGMNVLELRKRFGKDLIMAGGMDKRVLASDKSSIRKMVEERIPLIEEGGYIPGCDHVIPPDVSWENYLYYRKLLLRIGK